MPVDVAAEITANTRLSSDYNVIALAAPEIARSAAPGQFVMVKAGAGLDPLLRRPFSVFEILQNEHGETIGFSLLNKKIGVSTSRLYDAEPGTVVKVLGPLGRPFSIVEPPSEAWMVAGGVGLAPFAALAQALVSRGVRTILYYGARTGRELFYLTWFRDLGVELVIATEDGSTGESGRITVPLERALKTRAEAGSRKSEAAGPVIVYACGPEGMLAATARLAARYNCRCQVSVERIMGCGLGGCYSCVVPMRTDEGPGFHHIRSCIAGPVLDGDRIAW
jgi:dihydroorotate dehydrogenase electron transfer subunit